MADTFFQPIPGLPGSPGISPALAAFLKMANQLQTPPPHIVNLLANQTQIAPPTPALSFGTDGTTRLAPDYAPAGTMDVFRQKAAEINNYYRRMAASGGPLA